MPPSSPARAAHRHIRTGRGRRRRRRKRQQRPLLIQRRRERRRRRYLRRSRRRLASRPWWERFPSQLLALEQRFPTEYGNFIREVVGKALVYSGEVEVPHTGHIRTISLVFSDQPAFQRPTVFADGPYTGRHRFGSFRPKPLCVWFSGDVEAMRWTLRDGLAGLIDLTRVHLLKEAVFRATGSWPGPEVHLTRELSAESPEGPRRPSPRLALKRHRQWCWCGVGRYRNCHGKISEADELEALGLA